MTKKTEAALLRRPRKLLSHMVNETEELMQQSWGFVNKKPHPSGAKL